MARYCLALLAGAYSLILLRALPPDGALVPICMVAAVCLGRLRLRLFGFLLLGMVTGWLAARLAIDDRLSDDLQGTTLSIRVRIVDFPVQRGPLVRFLAAPVSGDSLPARIRLSWYAPVQVPRIGETWTLDVRLRRPRGYANPSGFDYERWLFWQGIGATGYVVDHANNERLREAAAIARLRQTVVARLDNLLPDDDAYAVLSAVATGARQHIGREQWELYAITGTSHLMAISGLHIGLAAGSVLVLAWGILSVIACRGNIRDRALVLAVVAAILYAAASGLSVPAQRALAMVALAALITLSRRQTAAGHLIAMGALLVFVLNPSAIHTAGFKLSFTAVLLIIWHGYRSAACPNRLKIAPALALWSGIRRLAGLQMMLLFGLFPLTVLLFDRASWLALPVNLVVLPIFNFVTVPATLLGVLLGGPLQSVGDGLLRGAHSSVQVVLWIIRRAADLPFAKLELPALHGYMVLVTALPALYAIAPPGWPGRRLAWLALLATIGYEPATPPEQCVDVHVLDVGQGLSVVLQTSTHSLVYDTGPAFRSGAAAADLALIPFLKRRGIESPDRLVVSHADLDHAGGVAALLREFPGIRVLAGEALPDPQLVQERCAAGAIWRWDGVEFRVLHPPAGDDWHGNNASCVLAVQAGQHALLLTGDIEAPIERWLVKRLQIADMTTVVVPHHGSGTSSGADFVNALQAQTAIVSAGHRNRWDFPRAEVVSRWQQAGTRVLTTADSGAISQRLCADREPGRIREQRRLVRRIWHDIPPRQAP